jgi:hypothetical protein
MNNIDRAFFHAGVISIILGFASIVYVFMTFVYPYKVMEMNSISVSNSPKPGEPVDLLVDICKFRETPVKMNYTLFKVEEFDGGKVSRKISDTIIESSSGKPGCTKFIDPTVKLPLNAESGDYQILITLSFEINKLKDVQYRYEVPFEVK